MLRCTSISLHSTQNNVHFHITIYYLQYKTFIESSTQIHHNDIPHTKLKLLLLRITHPYILIPNRRSPIKSRQSQRLCRLQEAIQCTAVRVALIQMRELRKQIFAYHLSLADDKVPGVDLIEEGIVHHQKYQSPVDLLVVNILEEKLRNRQYRLSTSISRQKDLPLYATVALQSQDSNGTGPYLQIGHSLAGCEVKIYVSKRTRSIIFTFTRYRVRGKNDAIYV